MSSRLHVVSFVCVFATSASVAISSASGQINNIVLFGDSISDAGNYFLVNGGTAPPTPWYSQRRFTNGPDNTADLLLRTATCTADGLWDEQLARRLGIPLAIPSRLGGRNYAFAGATTASTTLLGGTYLNIGAQVSAYRTAPLPDPNRALFVIQGGGNDLIRATFAAGATPQSIMAASNAAVVNLRNSIQSLAINLPTGQHITILWPNLSPYDLSPLFGPGVSAALRQAFGGAVVQYNAGQLTAAAVLRANPVFTVHIQDTYTIFNDLIAGRFDWVPVDSTHQIVLGDLNAAVPQPSRNNAVPDGVDADAFIWWDEIHFTARMHQLLGDAAACIVAPLTFAQHPSGGEACLGSPVAFTVSVTGVGPIAFQWRKGTEAIPNETSSTLTIQSVAFDDVGTYECLVSNSCGNLTSDAVELSVRGCCPGDFNGDGVISSADFFDFLVGFFNDNGDFNHDGVTSSQDFFDFLAAFFAGC